MSAAAQQRNEVTKVAAKNVDKAVRLAKKIDDPWSRCQAHAWTAWNAGEAEFDEIIKAAMTSCLACEDPYRVVGSSAWPLRAMVERGHKAQLERSVSRVLPVAVRIENPVSRADTLFLIWQAVYPAGGKSQRLALDP